MCSDGCTPGSRKLRHWGPFHGCAHGSKIHSLRGSSVCHTQSNHTESKIKGLVASVSGGDFLPGFPHMACVPVCVRVCVLCVCFLMKTCIILQKHPKDSI